MTNTEMPLRIPRKDLDIRCQYSNNSPFGRTGHRKILAIWILSIIIIIIATYFFGIS